MNFNAYKNCTFFAKIILPCLFLVGCSSDYQWGWYVVNPVNKTGISNIGFLLSGLQFTIYLSLIAIFFSIIIGLLIIYSISKLVYKIIALILFYRFKIKKKLVS